MGNVIFLALTIACLWNWVINILPGYRFFVTKKFKTRKFWLKLATCSVCVPNHAGLITGSVIAISGGSLYFLLTGVLASVMSSVIDRNMNG